MREILLQRDCDFEQDDDPRTEEWKKVMKEDAVEEKCGRCGATGWTPMYNVLEITATEGEYIFVCTDCAETWKWKDGERQVPDNAGFMIDLESYARLQRMGATPEEIAKTCVALQEVSPVVKVDLPEGHEFYAALKAVVFEMADMFTELHNPKADTIQLIVRTITENDPVEGSRLMGKLIADLRKFVQENDEEFNKLRDQK
jgi:hypothetical protein